MAVNIRKPTESAALRHILVVDDEAAIREVLKSYLGEHGYRVSTASSGGDALRSIKYSPVDVMILDVLLEDSDGLELMAKLRKSRPHLPVIIITGLGADDDLMRRAVEKGASECVSKTAPLEQLRVSIERVLAAKAAEAAEKPPSATSPQARRTRPAGPSTLTQSSPPATKSGNARQTASYGGVEEALKRVSANTAGMTQPFPRDASAEAPKGDGERTQAAHTTSPAEAQATSQAAPVVPVAETPPAEPASIAHLMALTPEAARFELGVEVFLRMLTAYHPNLGNTAMRAAFLCKALGDILQLSLNQRQNLLWAAALHDISLVEIDRGIVARWMRSPDKCAEEELILIKRHPERSRQMLEPFPDCKEAGEIICAHHENWDGTGYPEGLKMEMIPWLSRLLAVVSFYCSRHSPSQKTIAEIEAQANSLYDPQAVEAVVKTVTITTLPRGEREVAAAELRPGMVLAGDIVDWDGVLILGKGQELTMATVNKVNHLREMGEIDPRFLVYC